MKVIGRDSGPVPPATTDLKEAEWPKSQRW